MSCHRPPFALNKTSPSAVTFDGLACLLESLVQDTPSLVAGRVRKEKRQAVAAQAQINRVARDGQHVAFAIAVVAGAVVVGCLRLWFH